MDAQKFRIVVLGAGFSRAAGFPLAADLWKMVSARARSLSGRATKFHADLNNYIEFRRKCDGVKLTADRVDMEDFLRVLDIEHFLGLRGSDTWSSDGNEGTIVAKTLIGQILAELTPSKNDIPKLYLDFAKRLEPDDLVLTFNYDVLLERALEVSEKPYRLFTTRYDSVFRFGGIVDMEKAQKEVRLLKLHGSIDWFDRTEYAEIERMHREAGQSTAPSHPVFGTEHDLGVTKLLDGPRQPDDPLDQMYRVRNLEALYRDQLMFRATPWLLAPSTMKIVYASKLRDFWRGFANAGILNFGLAIVGYSLPPQDEYSRQIIYGLVTNYQQNHWNKKVFGMRKGPLVIVDRCGDAAQLRRFKRRYKFVDWRRARLCRDGLNEAAMNQIFEA